MSTYDLGGALWANPALTAGDILSLSMIGRKIRNGGLVRTIWRIFTRDLMRILRNPVAVVVTLGVAIIPSLYAWCNILATWDP